MENLFTYLALSGLYITFLYLGFVVASYKNYNFSNQRLLGLTSLCIALVLPLIHLGNISQEAAYSYNLTMLEISSLSQAITSSTTIEFQKFDWLNLLLICFLLGAFLSSLRFLYAITKLVFIIRNGVKLPYNDHQVVKTNEIKSPCSFWSFNLVPSTFKLNDQTSTLILEHEEKHLELYHSLDSILLSLLQILFWWLPTYYLFQHRLKLIHEYEVDAYMTQNQDTLIYSNFLIEQVPIHQKLLHTNNFYSFIKKRIYMMYREKKSSSKVVRYGIYTLLIPILFLFQSFQTIDGRDGDDERQTYIEKVTNTIYVFDPVTKKETKKEETFDRIVHQEVDQAPLFVSCIDLSKSEEEMKNCSQIKLMSYLGEKLKFPKEAEAANINGKLICEFTITDIGKVESIKIKNPLGYGTSEAVTAVIDGLNHSDLKWKPALVDGKAVNVKYILPVKFKLQ